jgi:predicted amidohydrolase
LARNDHPGFNRTRAAENTVWFASCNPCLIPYQNCRSLVVAPDGQIHNQSELGREELLVTEIDVSRATRAMFNYDLEGCAPLLFGETVHREEYQEALPKQ